MKKSLEPALDNTLEAKTIQSKIHESSRTLLYICGSMYSLLFQFGPFFSYGFRLILRFSGGAINGILQISKIILEFFRFFGRQ